MSSANFKLKRTSAASRGFLATARFSCIHILGKLKIGFYSRLHDSDNVVLQCCMSQCQRGGWSQLFSQYNVNVGEFVQFHVIFDSFHSSVLCV